MLQIALTALPASSNSDLHWLMANSNLLRVQLRDGSFRDLVEPRIGRDFLAGILEDHQTLGVFRKSLIRNVEFVSTKDLESGVLEYTRKTIGELLTNIRFPTLGRLAYLDLFGSSEQITVLGVAKDFLFTDTYRNQAIPIASLAAIELRCA